MKVSTFFYQIFLAGPNLEVRQFLGTAFPIAPNGGLMTCRYVTDVNKTEDELLVIVDGQSNQAVPIGDIKYPSLPDLDIAFIPNALKRRKREFFPVLSPEAVILGTDVYSVGFFVSGERPEVGYFKGNIVSLGQSIGRQGLTSVSLSYPVIEGLSGSPVLTYHNGPKVVGLCHGSVQSRISPREILEYEDEKVTFKETVTRIVELGLAHHASVIIDFLREVEAPGYIVSSDRVPGIFDN